jgi:hypothetical protein
MYAVDVSESAVEPDYDNLTNGKVRLYYLTPDEVTALEAAA